MLSDDNIVNCLLFVDSYPVRCCYGFVPQVPPTVGLEGEIYRVVIV
jgi:hypothetical protein